LPNQGLHGIVAKVKNIILDQIKMETMHGHNAIAVYIAMSDHSQILNASHFRQALGSCHNMHLTHLSYLFASYMRNRVSAIRIIAIPQHLSCFKRIHLVWPKKSKTGRNTTIQLLALDVNSVMR
jgi:hypothetical protein